MWNIFSRDPTKDFPYDINQQQIITDTSSVWTICKGRRKSGLTSAPGASGGTNEEITIFIYDIKSGNDQKLELARSFVKRVKTLRHPGLLLYIDSVETDKVIYVATENVEPLGYAMSKWEMNAKQKSLYVSWGFYQISRALGFLINDCNLRHNNVSCWSVFVNASGEWKLGGFEYVTPSDVAYSNPYRFPGHLDVYDAPEKGRTTTTATGLKQATDMWGFGCLIWECFNEPLRSKANLKDTQKIPKNIIPLYMKLMSTDPGSRPNPKDILEKGSQANGFFRNPLIDTLIFLEEIQIKDKTEKNKFFSSITDQLDNLPDNVCRHKILPQLITAYEYGDAGSAILAPLFKLGRLLEEDEYQKKIVPCVVKLFSSTDRMTRSRLLLSIDHFVAHLHPKVVNEQIFPQVAHGFMDTNPTIREQTVKAIIHLAGKLNYNNLNVEVLRHFARLQSRDDQGGIRTNTTVCLGKIANHIHPEVRQRVLISAFIRAIRDPFPPARIAGVLALAATQQYYLLSEVATKILPNLFPLTIDMDKTVRDPAFKTIKGFMTKLERVSDDPALKEQFESDVLTTTPSLSNATATWTGWAMSAVTSKFYKNNPGDKASSSTKPGTDSSSTEKDTGSIASGKTTATYSTTSSNVSQHSEDPPDEIDEGEWGEMETTSSSSMTQNLQRKESTASSTGMPSTAAKDADGWDDDGDDWENFNETKPKAKLETTRKPPSVAVPAASSMDLPMPSLSRLSINKPTPVAPSVSAPKQDSWTEGGGADDWSNSKFTPVNEDTDKNSRMDEAKRKREERKQQRLKEIEAKRAAKSGPMKLGSSSKDMLWDELQ